MEIDLASSVPIFRQIVDGICAAVAAGVYKPGELIPSVRQQAITLLVNPNTVQRAYEQLERDGLLLTRRGSGMEVAESNDASRRDAARGVSSPSRHYAERAGDENSRPRHAHW